jgi:septal ring factor EnvC (AmiA/AmiB activator)
MKRLAALALAGSIGLASASLLMPLAAAFATEDIGKRLESVEREIEKGRAWEQELEHKTLELERDIQGLRASLVTSARAVQNLEEKLTALEHRLDELGLTEQRKLQALEARRATLAAMLGALQRLARQPPEALVAAPGSYTDTIRSSILLAALAANLNGEARTVRRELAQLARLRDQIAGERIEAGRATGELEVERERIDGLLAYKSALQNQTIEERRAVEASVKRLGSEAADLRDLVERLAAISVPPPEEKPEEPQVASLAPMDPSPTPQPPFSEARGTLPLPVRGRVIGTFGAPTTNGVSAKGITIETRAGAQVVTPYGGRVVFAGPFRGYGELLIIEHGEGYHMLFAGLSRIDCVLGQSLLAGEPVGIMGSIDGGGPSLYVELRHDGEAINPLPWLVESARKVSG